MILLAFLIGCSVTLSQTKISLVVHDKLLFIFVFSNNNSNNLHIRVRISYCILHITLHYIITFLHILISSSWISSLIFFTCSPVYLIIVFLIVHYFKFCYGLIFIKNKKVSVENCWWAKLTLAIICFASCNDCNDWGEDLTMRPGTPWLTICQLQVVIR